MKIAGNGSNALISKAHLYWTVGGERAEIMKDKEGVSMRISLLDRSLYYKGLMILIRQDRRYMMKKRR